MFKSLLLIKERKTIASSVLKIDKNLLKTLLELEAISIHFSPLQKPYKLIKLKSKEKLLEAYLVLSKVKPEDLIFMLILYSCGRTPLSIVDKNFLKKLLKRRVVKIEKYNIDLTTKGRKFIENCLKLFQ